MTQLKPIGEISKPIFTVEVFITYHNEVLLQKRSISMKKFPGWWSIPGGHIDENEDPLAAGIREVKEETDITILPEDIKLKYIAMHNHLDRNEMYVAFGYSTELAQKIIPTNSEEGNSTWYDKSDALKLENVFTPVKYYFNHVLNNIPGIMYCMSDWENTSLVKVHSQTIDSNS